MAAAWEDHGLQSDWHTLVAPGRLLQIPSCITSVTHQLMHNIRALARRTHCWVVPCMNRLLEAHIAQHAVAVCTPSSSRMALANHARMISATLWRTKSSRSSCAWNRQSWPSAAYSCKELTHGRISRRSVCTHTRVQVQEVALERAELLPLRTAMLLASVLFLPAVCTSSTMLVCSADVLSCSSRHTPLTSSTCARRALCAW